MPIVIVEATRDPIWPFSGLKRKVERSPDAANTFTELVLIEDRPRELVTREEKDARLRVIEGVSICEELIEDTEICCVENAATLYVDKYARLPRPWFVLVIVVWIELRDSTGLDIIKRTPEEIFIGKVLTDKDDTRISELAILVVDKICAFAEAEDKKVNAIV
jgi:hypothetical protein